MPTNRLRLQVTSKIPWNFSVKGSEEMTQSCILPVPYPDELLYSVITRYHLRIHNESPKWTFREIFGTENVIPTIDLPSHLESLATRSSAHGMTADDWIDRHTFFPYYAPFIPMERANRLRTLMKSLDGSDRVSIR